ncbi:MAG: VPLPA-CTERM sorting domain-containing protein [Methylomicrobium sp.]|nr:VPLPA-CTERM sorting domain-containing protein [Methylomicrobium sp.]
MTTKLAKAVSLALAGSALTIGSVSSASAHVMYNIFQTASPTATDGWVRIADTNGDGIKTGPESQGNKGTVMPWVGTAGNGLPFGYTGSSHLNWAAALHSVGGTYEVSTQNAINSYGFKAEIDTGAGAWQDEGIDANGNPTANGPTGWKHQTDIGLIKADEDMWVTLKPSVVTGTGYDIQNFGITVFTGMDKNTQNYSHHGAWNCPGCATPSNFDKNDPFYQNNANLIPSLTYLTHSGTVDADNGLSFLALAGQVYSVYLGGAGVGRWNANIADYKLEISTSPVPVPAAVWLMGSGLVGLMSFGRKKEKTA